jgi:hypothetical protein
MDMAGSRSGPPVKTEACPCVADLLDYAQGSADSADRQRIETHLNSTGCGYCRSWIARVTNDPPPAPVAGAAKWQRQAAFRELERRLRFLDECS